MKLQQWLTSRKDYEVVTYICVLSIVSFGLGLLVGLNRGVLKTIRALPPYGRATAAHERTLYSLRMEITETEQRAKRMARTLGEDHPLVLEQRRRLLGLNMRAWAALGDAMVTGEGERKDF